MSLPTLRRAILPTARLSRRYAASTLPRVRFNSGSAVRDPMTGEFTALPDIQANRLVFTRNEKPKPIPPSKSLVFGHTFTDHMLVVPWNLATGWGAPEIRPYGPFEFHPSTTVLHYAQTVFEGMKAYRDENGKVTLFRPDMNMKRMKRSAERIALPGFDGEAMVELIKELVRTDKHWIPQEPGHSLYIRPTLIGTTPAIGVAPPSEALLFVICSPVGPYYPQGFKPISLYGTIDYIRAAPGGTGAYKLGVNYAPGLLPQREAAKHGYQQNLWLHGPEHLLTEVGTMNLFVVFKRPDGKTEIVTPPLDGMILPGVTRDSVLSIAREHAAGTYKLKDLPDSLVITERPVTMKEVQKASKDGSLLELFGAGTAAVITPVERIGYLGEDVHIPTGPDGMGPISKAIWTELVGRQTGKVPHEWSVTVCE